MGTPYSKRNGAPREHGLEDKDGISPQPKARPVRGIAMSVPAIEHLCPLGVPAVVDVTVCQHEEERVVANDCEQPTQEGGLGRAKVCVEELRAW